MIWIGIQILIGFQFWIRLLSLYFDYYKFQGNKQKEYRIKGQHNIQLQQDKTSIRLLFTCGLITSTWPYILIKYLQKINFSKFLSHFFFRTLVRNFIPRGTIQNLLLKRVIFMCQRGSLLWVLSIPGGFVPPVPPLTKALLFKFILEWLGNHLQDVIAPSCHIYSAWLSWE